MKIFSSNQAKFRLAGNPLPKLELTAAKPSAFACASGKPVMTAASRSSGTGTRSGLLSGARGPTADEDFRGLSAEYVADEASKSLFAMALFLVLAVHCTMGVAGLAMYQLYLMAALLSVPASIFWRNAAREGARAARLYNGR